MTDLTKLTDKELINHIKGSGATAYACRREYTKTVFDDELIRRLDEAADLRNQLSQAQKAVEAMNQLECICPGISGVCDKCMEVIEALKESAK